MKTFQQKEKTPVIPRLRTRSTTTNAEHVKLWFWQIPCRGVWFWQIPCRGVWFWQIPCRGVWFWQIPCRGGIFCEKYQSRDRYNFPSDSEVNYCPVIDIFRKYPTSAWYICIITLPIFLSFFKNKYKLNVFSSTL